MIYRVLIFALSFYNEFKYTATRFWFKPMQLINSFF